MLSSVADSTSLANGGDLRKDPLRTYTEQSEAYLSTTYEPRGARIRDDVMMESSYYGPVNSKNTSLSLSETIRKMGSHKRSPTVGPDDPIYGSVYSYDIERFHSKNATRPATSVHMNVYNPHPSMTVQSRDVHHPIDAQNGYGYGGRGKKEMPGFEFMGAGNDLPKLDSQKINKAPGIDSMYDQGGAFVPYARMAKKNFMNSTIDKLLQDD